MNLIKTVIVENKLPVNSSIENKLSAHLDTISIVGKASDNNAAKTLILEQSPDLIIAEINIGKENSFDLLKSLGEENFSCKVIFISDDDNVTLPALDYKPFGYLFKPIDPVKLCSLLKKLENNLAANKKAIPPHRKVVFKTQEGWHIVELNNIIRCESDKGYSTIYTKHQGSITLAKKIIDLQKIIYGSQFLRIHQSHIVNVNEIQLLKKGRNTMIRLSDGSLLPVSASKKQVVFDCVSAYPGI